MKKTKISLLAFALLVSGICVSVNAARNRGFALNVLVNSVPRSEYRGNGNVYIEAVRGREYTLRIHNPLPRRVAVALAVDGLNTIDAKRTSAEKARKWVLDPYETITITGWQVSGRHSRKFYFTGEKGSYGALLGQTDNLGVIEAVFFAEKTPPPPCRHPHYYKDRSLGLGGAPGCSESKSQSRKAAPSPSMEQEKGCSGSIDNDYAATGIGRKTYNPVTRVYMKLESRPRAVVRIRYEFRPQLVKMGLIPKPEPKPTPVYRREKATGFERAWCPDPYKH